MVRQVWTRFQFRGYRVLPTHESAPSQRLPGPPIESPPRQSHERAGWRLPPGPACEKGGMIPEGQAGGPEIRVTVADPLVSELVTQPMVVLWPGWSASMALVRPLTEEMA